MNIDVNLFTFISFVWSQTPVDFYRVRSILNCKAFVRAWVNYSCICSSNGITLSIFLSLKFCMKKIVHGIIVSPRFKSNFVEWQFKSNLRIIFTRVQNHRWYAEEGRMSWQKRKTVLENTARHTRKDPWVSSRRKIRTRKLEDRSARKIAHFSRRNSRVEGNWRWGSMPSFSFVCTSEEGWTSLLWIDAVRYAF